MRRAARLPGTTSSVLSAPNVERPKQRCVRVLAALKRPSCASVSHPRIQRGRREGRALTAPVARLQNKKQAADTTGSAKSSGIPCAMVLTLIARSWEPGFVAPIISEIISRRLDTSVGVSGPHDFSVRNGITRPRKACALTPSRPPHPASRVVTIAHMPLLPRRDASDKHTLPKNGIKIFLAAGLDSGLSVESAREFRSLEHAVFHSGSRPAHPERHRTQLIRRSGGPAGSPKGIRKLCRIPAAPRSGFRREDVRSAERTGCASATSGLPEHLYATAAAPERAADLSRRQISDALGHERSSRAL
jgi:hypothetical protein